MAKNNIQDNIDLFKCPVCGNQMDIFDTQSLICSRNHCFDLAKNGYVNLLLGSVKTEYDKEMYRARNNLSKKSLFAPMIESVSDIILKNLDSINSTGPKKYRILDVGCGEGSHLDQVIKKLRAKVKKSGPVHFEGAGIDISKEGIRIAAKEYPDYIWCVGDLAKNPFMSQKFAVLLNIFSPANYSEFKRLISDTGILIKVVPGNNYLKELRELFYDQTDKQEYSNEEVVKYFCDNFHVIEQRPVLYTVALGEDYLEQIIKATPLSWSAPKEKILTALEIGLKKITLEFVIMCGRKQ